jgi:precorrin-6B methylase 2
VQVRQRVHGVGHSDALREVSCEEAQSLSRFAKEGRRFEFVFIDGDHKFDGVLIDFTLAALICKPGGHIVLDDTHMEPVQKAVSFIRKNRADFTEVPTSNTRFAIFQMTDTDKRKWDHFVPF